jgi:putative MATE family efflux protein
MNRRVSALLVADQDYFRDIVRIGLPIVLQSLIFNGLALVDNILIGGLGDAPVAALGVANRLGFIYALLLFGIHSGANMFGSQFWGKRDLVGVRKVLVVSLLAGLGSSTIFLMVTQWGAVPFMRFFIADEEVVAQGAAFLKILGWSYLFQGITSAFSIQSRGVGRTQPPLVASSIALLVNTGLGYVLIYGRLGLPAMGIRGAAVGLLVSRVLEAAILVGIIYRRNYELAATLRDVRGITRDFLRRLIRPVLPVIGNELFWAIGISMYTFFYGQMGRSATASAQILEVLNGLFMAVFMGFGNACGTLVGNSIGAGRDALARRYANRSALYGALGAVLMGVVVWLTAPVFLGFFSVGEDIVRSARMASVVYALFMPAKVINMVMIVGVCRNGGDTLFAAVIDVLSPWLVGIPMAALGVYVLKWPFHLVYALVLTEEVVKAGLGIWRLKSGKWLHNLVRDVSPVPESLAASLMPDEVD